MIALLAIGHLETTVQKTWPKASVAHHPLDIPTATFTVHLDNFQLVVTVKHTFCKRPPLEQCPRLNRSLYLHL